ncbi:secreted aspartic proteinase precursor [Xylariaceae sp. FL0804]|nr:secreted aspartic proteinase precursor [Xylariaceae sp. FL0804]
MPSFTQACLVAMALSTGLAAPVEEQKGHFSVKQVRNRNYKKPSGAHAMAKAFRKYGAPYPDYLSKALNTTYATTKPKRATTQGSAVNTPEEYDSEYLTPVSIGTPAQKLNMDFDTGSADLWVFSSELPAGDRSGHSVYTPGSSSTAKQLAGSTWEIEYGDGSSASGNVYTDTVTIAGVTVAGQAVEAAEQLSSEFESDSDNDGLVGLAFSSINQVSPKPQKTFFDNAKASLTSPLFAADLVHDAPGVYDFGYTDSAKYTGSITYASVNSAAGFWTFPLSGYKVGGTSYSGTTSVIADTGTSLLLLPEAIAVDYYEQVDGAELSEAAGGFVFPCSATLPTFAYKVGSATITVPAAYLNYEPFEDDYCFGGLQSSEGLGENILGDVGLKAAYVVFDGTTSPRIGFASKST